MAKMIWETFASGQSCGIIYFFQQQKNQCSQNLGHDFISVESWVEYLFCWYDLRLWWYGSRAVVWQQLLGPQMMAEGALSGAHS